jgi:hypothetical protein
MCLLSEVVQRSDGCRLELMKRKRSGYCAYGLIGLGGGCSPHGLNATGARFVMASARGLSLYVVVISETQHGVVSDKVGEILEAPGHEFGKPRVTVVLRYSLGDLCQLHLGEKLRLH